jgi:Flp pilus assembly protein TadD
MRALVPLLLAVVLASCASNRGRLSGEEVEALYRNALQRYETGDHAGALQRLKLIRDTRPEYPGLHHRMGLCYAKLGMASFAIESLRRATEAEPDDADVRLDLAVALEMGGLTREAETLYLQMVQARPSDARVRLNLGLLYARRLAEPAKAREQLERYLQLDPEAADAPEIRRWLTEQAPEPSAPR